MKISESLKGKSLSTFRILTLLLFATTTNAQWTRDDGPNGGTILSLGITSNGTIYAAAGKGVFISQDNGSSWFGKGMGESPGIVARATTSVGNTMFVGGYGIQRSIDNGNSWQQMGLNANVNCMTSKANTIVAGTDKGIYQSTDLGTNWSLVNSLTESIMVAFDGSILYVGTYSGLLKSNDGGSTLNKTPITNSPYSLVRIDTVLFVSSYGSSYALADGDTEWTSFPYDNSHVAISAYSQVAIDTSLYMATDGGVFKFSWNDSTWTNKSKGLINKRVVSLIANGSALYAGTNGSGVFVSRNGGNTWTESDEGLTGSVTYSMVATDDELWAGTRTSGVFRTSSTDWHPDIDGLNENGIQVISMAKSGDDVYVDALGGVYYQGDTSWLRFNSLDQHFISCVAASGNNIYAGTGSAIYISRDKGTSWTKGAIPEQGIQGIWADGDEVWAAGQYLYKSTDRGLTWYQVEVKPPNRQGSAIQGMWCVVKKGADLYLGSNGGVFYSPDNGTTWLQNSYDNPNGAQIRSLVMYGKYVIAGSGSGVFISDDRGDHWRSFNDGLPLFRNIPGFTNYVYTLCIFNGRIYVGNDDGGTFSRPVSDLQLLNGSLNVYADDENHPDLKRNELILSTDFLDEELPPIKICADGSNVTLLKYVNHNPALANSSIKFRIQSEGLISVTGEFKDEDIRISGDTIIARLTHPQLVIPTITKAFDYRPDSIEIFNVTQDTVLHTYPIEIYRAPLVLVHGLWGDRNSFDGMYHAYDRNIPWIRPVDYATTNSSNFSTNRRVVRDAIDAILSNARSSSFLTGKAVVVGHSMGGILTRLYLQNAFTDVFYRNDISKVITLNTPHYGSQSANFLIGAHLAGIFNRAMKMSLSSDDYGAISDLQVGSFAMSQLNMPQADQNLVPSSTISTDATGDGYSGATMLRNLISIADGPALFNLESNDLVVAKSSQMAKLNLNPIISGQWHVGSPNNSAMIQRVLKLIDSSPADVTRFTNSGFPQGYLSKPLFNFFTSSNSGRIQSDSLKITHPLQEQKFNAGDSVTVELLKSNIPNAMLFVFGSTIDPIAINLPAESSSAKLKIPDSAVGKLTIWSIGKGVDNMIKQDTLSIEINSLVEPDSIVISPGSINATTGINFGILVKASYSGNQADICDAADVQYVFDATFLSRVSGPIFNPRHSGTTKVIVRFHDKTKSIIVTIADDPSKYISSFDRSQPEICAGKSVNFTDRSIGPVISYAWSFPGGTPKTSTEAKPKILYSSAGEYPVKLITSFAGGADSITIDNLVNVHAVPSVPTISKAGNTLTSSASEGNQWYLDGQQIDGATFNTIQVTKEGTYTLETTLNSCPSGKSQPVIVNSITGINEVIDSIFIYPIPSKGMIFIDVSASDLPINVEVLSLLGTIVYNANVSDGETPIDLSDVARGFYTVRVKLGDVVRSYKIILN